MDKKILQSIGLEIGLPRWQAYLLYLVLASLGAVVSWLMAVIFLGIFG
jgi:hypothetical protein